MYYNWREIDRDGSRNDFPYTEYQMSFPYTDGSPQYGKAEASIKRVKKHIGYTPQYLHSQGIDPNEMTWQGEVGATNYMAESLASGWDSFFRIKDDDFNTVFNETTAYLDELMETGNVDQEWINENTW